MYLWKRILPLLLGLLFMVLVMCFNINSIMHSSALNFNSIKQPKHYGTPIISYNETESYLIDTPGCLIPDYSKTLRFKEALNSKNTCGQRAVFIEKISDDVITFRVDKEKLEKYGTKLGNVRCCYRFASRHTAQGKEDSDIIYSPCEKFQNGTKAKLQQEVITVSCVHDTGKSEQTKTIYSDAYLVLKKIIKTTDRKTNNDAWNVLLLGMDTMSRARIFNSMPKTINYFQQHKWLDYRGYQKVEYNTFPNLMSVLTGKNMSSIYRACANGMYECNHLMIWSHFRDAGYITAYGEDFLRLPDTFSPHKGFKILPTDHYTRPFFLTGEILTGNLVCAEKLPSAIHLLDYAFDFSKTYKKENFFGMFWLNSYSHNLQNLPTLIDTDMITFFERLNSTGVLNNTIICFFSDHGIRFGEMRMSIESFYEERLPMLFMWVPPGFRNVYKEIYYNLQINQYRLTTPYDLHGTLWNILKISNNTVNVTASEACPQCTGLFEEISTYRKCADANIDKKWCSCYNMTAVNRTETGAIRSLQLAVSYIQNLTKTIETTACNVCSPLKLNNVLREHSYRSDYDNKTYYVVAFEMTPGNVRYEVTVETDSNVFNILQPTHTISPYNIRGSCVKNRHHREYCVCNVIKNCNKNKS